MLEICVLGAGIIGLSTGVRLQEQLRNGHPGVKVTIIADQFTPDTTGDGSAGIWEPYLLGARQDAALLLKWQTQTFQHMVSLAQSDVASQVGAFLISGYSISKEQVKLPPPWKDTVYGMREMTADEMTLFPNHKSGLFYTTVITECKKYLPWLMKRFLENGGTIVKRKIHTITEVPPQYSVVVVCCGIGSGRLLGGDPELIPVTGQVLRVNAPTVKHFVMDDENDLYIIPCSNNVVVGGTHEEGQTDTTVNQYQRRRILEGTAKLVPGLKNCEVVGEFVGVRPTRSSVRLEKQTVDCGCNRRIRIVYNYGHGGSGVSLHWGCAGEAVTLVQEHIQDMLLNSSKL